MKRNEKKGKSEKIRTKVIKINGIKTTVIIPQKLEPKDIPNKLKSEENSPRGLVLTL